MEPVSPPAVIRTGAARSQLMRSYEEELRELFRSRSRFPVPAQIDRLTGPSTLSRETLSFIGAVIEQHRPQSILEFGSGVSTLWFSMYIEEHPECRLISIDDSASYLEKTRDMVERKQRISYICAPISPYWFRMKRFAAYSPDWTREIQPNTRFDIVLIDGPLGYRFGREAALYQAAPFLHPRSLILLDDANRPPEQRALRGWRRVWGEGLETVDFPGLKQGLVALRIRRPEAIQFAPFGLGEIVASWRSSTKALRTVDADGVQ